MRINHPLRQGHKHSCHKPERTTESKEQDRGIELRVWQHGAIFLIACALLVSRRPDAIFHAQFYAEEGHVWFADAYNLGWWNALFRAQDGYFQTVSRLGGALALLVPMTLAPLVMNVIAIAVQALPVNLLLISRSVGWGDLRFRLVLAAAYLALPNFGELAFGITESQWLLALSAFLLLVARAPKSWVGRLCELCLLLLSGASGPFCIFLLPIAVLVAWRRRSHWEWAPVCVLAACALIQALALLVIDNSSRAHPPLGASAAMFARILGGNVILGAILGRFPVAIMPGRGIFILLLCASIAGLIIIAWSFIHSNIEMKLFFVFAGMIFLAALLFPVTNPPPGTTVWTMLAKAFAVRYWVFPSLAFAWAVLWCIRNGSAAWRSISVLILCAMCFGAVPNWRQPGMKDLHFAEFAKRFEAEPAGAVLMIPENPDGWRIQLEKHPVR
jgi:hypothetical protein